MNALCERRADAWNGFQLRYRGVLDAFPPTKMTQERLEFFRTKPLHRFERVGKAAAASSLAMKGVDEAVRFVSSMDQHPS